MIINIDKIKQIKPHLKKRSLVAFDLDDTLVVSSTHYGSTKWEGELIQEYLKQGLTKKEAQIKGWDIWEKAQHDIKLILIEDDVPIFLNNIKKNHHVIGLTARPGALKELTVHNLKNNNIIFHSFNCSLNAFYEGILFCHGKPKSVFLSNFIDQVFKNEKPNNILFIDDKKENLEDILNSSLINRFDIKCFHYSNNINLLH